jgi:hypothetical protein
MGTAVNLFFPGRACRCGGTKTAQEEAGSISIAQDPCHAEMRKTSKSKLRKFKQSSTLRKEISHAKAAKAAKEIDGWRKLGIVPSWSILPANSPRLGTLRSLREINSAFRNLLEGSKFGLPGTFERIMKESHCPESRVTMKLKLGI